MLQAVIPARFGNTLAVLGAACVLLTATTARAEFLVWGVNPNPQVVGATQAPLALAVPPAPTGALDVTVPAATVLIITFSAECSVSGTGQTRYADIDIQVDKAPRDGVFVTVPPTSADDEFCSSNGTVAADGRVTASRTVADTIPGGTSSVRVVARTVGAGGNARLDDLALLVAR